MIRKTCLLLFFMVLGTLAWKATGNLDADALIKNKNFLNQVTSFSQAFQNRIRNPAVQAKLKETKLAFAGHEIPLYFTQENILKLIRTDARAQRALGIFALFLFNIWLLPLIVSFRQRKLKEVLFDLQPDLAVDHPKESRSTPHYASTFFKRTFYTSNLGTGVLLGSYFFLPLALGLILGFTGYAVLSYHLNTRKYESVAHFHEANERGGMAKQIWAYFSPPPKKTAYDQIHHKALVKVQKRKVG